ncbi:MAG: hypothetical protein QOH49_4913 [Acidobacteriota bacterium]|jgi:hypothetical protein|nr:hypothetical protein [Acidobacteriota bacterium]
MRRLEVRQCVHRVIFIYAQAAHGWGQLMSNFQHLTLTLASSLSDKF